MKIKAACLALVLAFTSLAHAQSTPKESLLVLSKDAHTLAIIDPVTLHAVARVPVGDDPHEVIASTDGTTAYVSDYGFGQFHTLSVVDVVHQQPLPAIDLGALQGPHGLDFVGGKVWFTAEGAKVVARYDPETKKIDWIMGTGQDRTHMLHVDRDQQTIIATNVNSATLSILEKRNIPSTTPLRTPSGNWEQTVIPVGKGSEGFDVSPSGNEVWVASAQDGTISIVDRASKKVTQTLQANVHGANRLKFTKDGKLVFVSSLSGPEVAVFDAATRREVKRIPVGHGAAGILMQPDGSRAYVACSPDNYVAVIDMKTMAVVGHIDAGGTPDGMAWASR